MESGRVVSKVLISLVYLSLVILVVSMFTLGWIIVHGQQEDLFNFTLGINPYYTQAKICIDFEGLETCNSSDVNSAYLPCT